MNRRQFIACSTACMACALGAPRALGALKPIDIGTLKDYPKDVISEKYAEHNFFVIRNKGRLYAAIATCPHKGNALVVHAMDKLRINCTGHDSEFTIEGIPTGGPAKKPLVRYAIRVDDKGRVLVDPGTQFEQRQWDDPKSFVKVE